MKWTKARINTTTEAVDFICVMLDELGIEGIEVEDNVPISEEDKKAMFIDILPEMPEDDHSAKVSFYMDVLEDNTDGSGTMGNTIEDMNSFSEIISKVREGLDEIAGYADIGEGTIEISQTEDKDWINNWKEFFKPFRVADDIIIKPTWEKLTEINDNDIVIEIDPGTAFGTGSHETTRLCISALRKHIHNDTKLLDVGCGSGILSIIGVKLGAKMALGTDIDPNALVATRENIVVNGLNEEKVKVLAGNIIDDAKLQGEVGFKEYDIAVANILADVIIPLSAEIAKHIKPGGLFISSGIIDMKSEEVKEAILANGFEIIETNQMGDWFSFTARKGK